MTPSEQQITAVYLSAVACAVILAVILVALWFYIASLIVRAYFPAKKPPPTPVFHDEEV